MTDTEALTEGQRARGKSGLRLAGALMFLPAVLCCAGTLAWPTLTTLLMSLRENSALEAGDFVGLENYLEVLDAPATGAALGFTLLLAVMRAVVVGVVPLLLALGLRGLGAVPRWLVRLAATVPTALYIPALIGLAWLVAAHPVSGLLPQPEGGPWLAGPGRARGLVVLIDALYVLAVSVALGLAAYLAALRGADDRVAWKPLLVVWAVSVLAAFASGLQTLGLPFALTGGGPANSTTSLALLQFNVGFVRFAFGRAAAMAVPVLAVLMVLGLLSAALLLACRLRLALAAPAKGNGSAFMPLLVVGLILFVPACMAAVAIPAWVSTQAVGTVGGAAGPSAFSTGRVLANTLLPPIPMVVLQVSVAWVSALGLSALRPLGRASEWLLLAFAPWLFVTLGPVSLVHFMALREAGTLNTWLGLIPPLRLSVPMLFVLALFFKGQAARWQAAADGGWGAFARHIVLPSLPLAGLLFALGWLVSVQELLWPLLIAQSPEWYTTSVAALAQAGAFGVDPRALAGVLTRLGLPLFVLFVILLGVFQVAVLDRLVVTTGDDREPLTE